MLGHATMAMTADTYGHLLPDLENDAAKMEAAHWRSWGKRQGVGSSPTGGTDSLTIQEITAEQGVLEAA
jgi:hypothetical protein